MSTRANLNKQDNDHRNSLLNLTNEQLQERLCHDCYRDYVLDSSTLSKYQGGGEFLRFTWRLRKNIQRHFPGCPSRLISSILSKCWKYMPITRHLLRSSDSRLCCHCGQLKREIAPLGDENNYSILSKLQRYDELKVSDGSVFDQDSPEELEWLLITGKYLQTTPNSSSSRCKGRNNLLKAASKKINDTQPTDLAINKAPNIYPSIDTSGTNINSVRGYQYAHSEFPLSNDTIESPSVESYQSLPKEPFCEKNILLCILNNVSTGDVCLPDDSCLTNKSNSRF